MSDEPIKFTFPSGRVEYLPRTPKAQHALNLSNPKHEMRPARKTLTQKILSYSAAITRWKLAGSPTRSQEDIDRIYSICETCKFFANAKRPHCKLCGCSLNRSPNGLVSKIAMATESCPLDPPKWAADITPKAT